MSLRFGREVLAIPGPTTVPDRVLQAMHRPAIDIYEGELVGITDSIRDDLRDVFRCDALPYIYIANGHGAWEAAISNTFSAGDKALVLESGRFAIGWGEMAAKLGVEIEVLNAPERQAVDPAAVEARLKADTAAEIKAILVVQIDTALWRRERYSRHQGGDRRRRASGPVHGDCIASLGCMDFDMTGWGVDLAVAGCQKGLMTPPGLSYVAAGPKARRRTRPPVSSLTTGTGHSGTGISTT